MATSGLAKGTRAIASAAGGSLANNLDFVVALEQAPNALTNQFVVIEQERRAQPRDHCAQ